MLSHSAVAIEYNITIGEAKAIEALAMAATLMVADGVKEEGGSRKMEAAGFTMRTLVGFSNGDETKVSRRARAFNYYVLSLLKDMEAIFSRRKQS